MQEEGVGKEEIKMRIERFQKYLKAHDIGGAIILQNVDRYYFTGTIQSSTLFIPAEGEEVLIVHKGIERAMEESPLKNIVKGKPSRIEDLIRENKISSERIGMELDVVPVNIYTKYKRYLSNVNIVDASHLIRKTRMIKSEYEISQIRRAASILDENMNQVKEILKPGITEIEVDAYLGYLIRKKGHMGMMRMRGWNQEMMYVHVLSGRTGSLISFLDSPQGGAGTCAAMAQGAGYKKIERNEPIEIDHGICINGYIGDQARTYVIGDLDDRLKRAHECSYEIHRFFMENARPGIYCNEIYNEAVKIASSWGLNEYFMGYGEGKVKFIGHGIGLEIDDFPVISPNFKEPLQENMTLSLEPKFVFPEMGVVGLEDIYLIKGDGVERITGIEQRIFYL